MSLVTRCLTAQFEIVSSAAGRCFRVFFAEIPAQWQPVLLVVSVVVLLVVSIMLCRYRVSLALFHLTPTNIQNSPCRDQYSTRYCDRLQRPPLRNSKRLASDYDGTFAVSRKANSVLKS